MDAVTMFDSTKEPLEELLRNIHAGKTQLPDFQRGWTWDDEHIKGLLASISMTYPVGVVMMLQAGNASVRFQPRPIEGADVSSDISPERLILDGQQRLTSLFLALRSRKPVPTRDPRGKSVHRWYYIDICKALDPAVDREDAIISVPEDKKVRNFRGEVIEDYSTTEKECAAEFFPVQLIYDTPAQTAWMIKYLQVESEHVVERAERWADIVQRVIQPFQQYQVPLILLRKELPKEAVCQVFERVNTGGVPLNVFELLTATYAADNFRLRPEWEERQKRFRKHKILSQLGNTDFLQAVTLVSTYMRKRTQNEMAISCKRKDILQLPLTDYQAWAEPTALGFEKAARLLARQCVFTARDMPYGTQIIPLAAIFVVLGDRADADPVRLKLARWYWCGVFGELYGSATETRFARDLADVVTWIEGGVEPLTVAEANFAPDRLRTMRTRNSAAYKGVSALLLLANACDFRTGDPIDLDVYDGENIDIHHIFPKDYCARMGIDPGIADCAINKTPLSATTNRIIGGHAPSSYLAMLERRFTVAPNRLDEMLRSHAIDPTALRSDDFESFIAARQQALLDLIENAMGKQSPYERGLADIRDTEPVASESRNTISEWS